MVAGLGLPAIGRRPPFRISTKAIAWAANDRMCGRFCKGVQLLFLLLVAGCLCCSAVCCFTPMVIFRNFQKRAAGVRSPAKTKQH